MPSDPRFEPCKTSVDDVIGWLRAARRHIRSAKRLVQPDEVGEVDVEQIIDACHAAVRKALSAHMHASGLKVASGADRHHAVVISYGESALADVPRELWRRVRALRKARNDADYTNPTGYRLGCADADDAIEIATQAVTIIGLAVRSLIEAQDRQEP